MNRAIEILRKVMRAFPIALEAIRKILGIFKPEPKRVCKCPKDKCKC